MVEEDGEGKGKGEEGEEGEEGDGDESGELPRLFKKK